MKKIFYGIALVTFLHPATVSAQTGKESFERQQFIANNDTLNYRILYPKHFTANKQYPVLLFLHGAGERGSDNEKQLIHGSELFLADDFRKSHPSVVIFPQCPEDDYWARVEVARDEMPYQFTYNYNEEPTEPMRLVMELMDSIQSLDYSKDNQIYVGGLSMGGMGTFEILYRKPEMFAAAFPICGGGDPNSVDEYANNVSLWVFHGAQDNVVLPSYSTDMVIALKKSGADVDYTLYKEANHNSWDSAFSEPGFIPWIYSNKKEH